jgi:glycosyltransferase involved in cell wall biosynthesis
MGSPASDPGRRSRIGVVVVAYNAEDTLAQVLDRLPEPFCERLEVIFVCDDASQDATYERGVAYQRRSDLPIELVRQPVNLGYGGNQKVGYNLAIERGLDVVVLLHGDGQYAPEVIDQLVDPIVAGRADAVFGSRMMVRGDARRGGMPFYKFVGNKVLTTTQNLLLGTKLSEFHSGYRAYSVATLRALPFNENSDDFNFDTQIILNLIEAKQRILEVPIPTFYGDEICYVNGMSYAKDIVLDTIRFARRTRPRRARAERRVQPASDAN